MVAPGAEMNATAFRTALLTVALLAGAADARAQSLPTDMGDGVSFGSLGADYGPPDYYIVQPGDTLWEISNRFLGNPFYWPRLWSINEYITNPHWIYPGNRVVFRLGSVVEPPHIDLDGVRTDGATVEPVDIVTAEAACGPNIRFTDTREARTYVANGFLADRSDVDVYGSVAKARPLGTQLATRDLLYLEVNDPEAYSCGDVVSVFRQTRKRVRHPTERGARYGDLYEVVAEATVVHRHGDYLTAVVRRSWSEAQRGDLVGPQVPVNVQVEVGPPRGELEGTIVERVHTEMYLMGSGETVFVDRGRADGVRVGNSFWVVEQRDEAFDTKAEDEDLPWSVVGRLVVVRVDEYSSTAVVTDADRALAVGMRVRQKLE